MAPQKFQHQLSCSPRNDGINFLTQAAHYIFANHLFKLLHAFHIYNKQGKKETIDTLLMGSDSDTWWNAVGNELGRLAKGIDNQLIATNTIKFTQKGEVPRGCNFTHVNFVRDFHPLKSEPFRVRLTVCGDRL